jgi:hypothetical protein
MATILGFAVGVFVRKEDEGKRKWRLVKGAGQPKR